MSEPRNLELTVEVEAASRGLGKRSVAAPGDVESGLHAAERIDLTRHSAREVAHAVRLALSAGATEAARGLAREGSEDHPADAELGTLARLLAPPRVLEAQLPPRPGARANQEWLRTHSAEHGGSWVALKDGELIASAKSLRAARAATTDFPDVFITRVA